jgi:nucleoside-diphosphate-sugar epimerase
LKVLLTGANGFVGSHILDSLRRRQIPTAALLRPGCDRRFIQPHLPAIQVCTGLISDPASLDAALGDITHVIHCAGATRALRPAGFFEPNQAGTSRLIEAINRRGRQICRLVHISSLAAAGPAGPDRPAREEDPPGPVSDYGRSKLGGETAITQDCQAPFVILRPPAVYGPRDAAFLTLFKMVRARFQVRFLGGFRALSLVYVTDLAEAAVELLTHPAAAGRTYYVAAAEAVSPRQIGAEIASLMGVRTLTLPFPVPLLWPVCLAMDLLSRLAGKPQLLNLQKYPEFRACGWVCDPSRLERETGLTCPTLLAAGVARTLDWYRAEGWLR